MSKKTEQASETQAEEAVETKQETQEKKAKVEKRKKPDRKIHTLYNIGTDKIVRLRPTCERCGAGYFMADHGNRYTCGHCGFTRYKRGENEHT